MAGSSFQLNGYERAYFSAFYLHFTFFYFSGNVGIFFACRMDRHKGMMPPAFSFFHISLTGIIPYVIMSHNIWKGRWLDVVYSLNKGTIGFLSSQDLW